MIISGLSPQRLNFLAVLSSNSISSQSGFMNLANRKAPKLSNQISAYFSCLREGPTENNFGLI
jgi:hypothetical protein